MLPEGRRRVFQHHGTARPHVGHGVFAFALGCVEHELELRRVRVDAAARVHTSCNRVPDAPDFDGRRVTLHATAK